MVCRCSLRAACFGRGCRLLGSFNVFSGGTTGVASGNSSADTPRPLGSFSDSTHRKKVSFRRHNSHELAALVKGQERHVSRAQLYGRRVLLGHINRDVADEDLKRACRMRRSCQSKSAITELLRQKEKDSEAKRTRKKIVQAANSRSSL